MSKHSRFLTFMFCDIVDSTKLSQSHEPEEAFELIEDFQRLCSAEIKAHEGFVARYMGDGVLAYFGYPIALENSAEAAVRCARTVVEKTRASDSGMQVRIGIANGRGVFGRLELSGGGAEIAAVSNAANLAARLQSQAEPNQIVVSDEVFHLLDGLFEFLPARSVALKGFEGERLIHAVSGIGRYASMSQLRAQQASDMVARENVLQIVLDAWEACVDERRGRSVLISGPGGIGKTTLLGEWRRRLGDDAHSITLYAGRFAEHTAFDPFKRFVERACALHSSGDLRQWLAGHLGNAEPCAEILEVLLGRRSSQLPPQVLRERLFQHLAELFTAMSASQPLAIIVEDLHWLDPSSLELLERLRSSFAGHALLIVATARPVEGLADTWDLRIDLDPLSPPWTEAMIDGLDPEGQLGEATRAHIMSKSGGVPLLVREFARATLAVLARQNDGVEIAVPESLLESFSAQLDRWGASKELVDLAAAIGEAFDADLLIRLLNRTHEDVSEALAGMVTGELLHSYRSGDRLLFDFSHALLRDAAYSALLPKQRVALHGRILEACLQLDPQFFQNNASQAAHHLAAVGRDVDAIGTLLQAAYARLVASHAAEARGLLTRAITLLPKVTAAEQRNGLELQAQTLLGLALTLLRGFGDDSVEKAYARAWEICGEIHDESEAEFAAIWGVRSHRYVTSQVHAAITMTGRMVSIASRLNDDKFGVLVDAIRVADHFSLGQFQKALHYARKVLASYDQARHGLLAVQYQMDPKALVLTFAPHCHALLGDADAAEAARRDAVAFVNALGLDFIKPYTNIWSLASTLFAHTPENILDLFDGQIALAQQLGNQYWVCVGTVWKAVAHERRGEFKQALAGFETGLDLLGKLGSQFAVAYLRAVYASVLAATGAAASAWPIFDSCVQHAERTGEKMYLPEIRRLWGKALLNSKAAHNDAAAAQFRAGLSLAKEQGAQYWIDRLLAEQRGPSSERSLVA